MKTQQELKDFGREFISWWRSNRKLVSEMFQEIIHPQLIMRHYYLFFSQSICIMGACGQCSGEGDTLYEAIENFNTQKKCLHISMEHLLNGGLDE